ncbi:MAG: hypothetical protein ACYDDO_06045 [Acidiferrobacterales bacterium]
MDAAVAGEMRGHGSVFRVVACNEFFYGRTKSAGANRPSIEVLAIDPVIPDRATQRCAGN